MRAIARPQEAGAGSRDRHSPAAGAMATVVAGRGCRAAGWAAGAAGRCPQRAAGAQATGTARGVPALCRKPGARRKAPV